MDQNPIPQPLAVAAPALEGGDDMEARRCGRCRRVFEDDPTPNLRGRDTAARDVRGRDAQGHQEWLCTPCEAILFPRRARSTAILTLVPPVDSAGEDTA